MWDTGNQRYVQSGLSDGKNRTGVCMCRGFLSRFIIKSFSLGLCIVAGMLAGCQRISTEQELVEFQQAGPVREEVNVSTLKLPEREPKPYCLVVGDLIQIEMPAVMGAVEAFLPEEQRQTGEAKGSHSSRVDKNGWINLPILGTVAVAGSTLATIETFLTDQYCPKYLRHKPSIVVRVLDYKTSPVVIIGGVEKPGVHKLRSDEMSLLAALGKAGGILISGAENIQIFRKGAPEENAILVKVVHQTIPTDDPKLEPGDKIVVKTRELPSFTVTGLVLKPGKYPYPPSERYNVMQAIAHAGGLNSIAMPEYVKVYRLNAKGEMISAILKTGGESGVSASNVEIKPGDVVAIEQTAATYTRIFLSQILNVGVSAGASVGP